MKANDIPLALTFDDVLLVPKYSEIKSRSDVSLSVQLTKGFTFKHPIVPSNMKTITGFEMMERMYLGGGLTILHRFMSLEKQLDVFNRLQNLYGDNIFNFCGASIGVKSEDYENLPKLIEVGIKIICVDVAHGHSLLCIEMTKHIAKKYPNVLLISGNSATYDGTVALCEAGADIVKINIGGGSICTTRINAATGIPSITTLIDSKLATDDFERNTGRKVFLMNDGGTKNSGDIAKALCFSDLTMCGNIFAGTDETPGEILSIDGEQFKKYDGSSTHKINHREGVTSLVPTKGLVISVLHSLFDGIRSACSYQGVNNLIDLKKNPQFVRMTGAGLIESNAHNVMVLK